MLYEQMDLMLKARERAINHLSHELITPLSIISGVLETVRRKIGAECFKDLDPDPQQRAPKCGSASQASAKDR